jgi:branched-chain amino acid transport system substrate-binding protein
MTIFNAFITNVVAKGLPPEALENVYAMHYYYYDLGNFADKEVAKSSKEFADMYKAKYGRPPDAYAAIAYIGYMEMFRGFEQSKSFDPAKAAAAVRSNNGSFTTLKGPARWREDHAAEYKYAAFLVKGKGAKDQKNEWDLFTVINAVGGEQVMPPLKSLGY